MPAIMVQSVSVFTGTDNDVLLAADNVELGTACGKLHRVSVLAITDAGVTAAPLSSIQPPSHRDAKLVRKIVMQCRCT